ncbi:recombinase family protein [Methylorubrum extorquens]|uniref:Recombinase n=1 Tax=Methylorubrum extorquens (strain CM4 / NCIMB 13688) TaxID=440085 RepID=B7L2V4_METC4|nr:recombinase family protein [Methylorubrum extorquens]ACK86162.1 Recombinase [Methylorubrum extorquens CM4]
MKRLNGLFDEAARDRRALAAELGARPPRMPGAGELKGRSPVLLSLPDVWLDRHGGAAEIVHTPTAGRAAIYTRFSTSAQTQTSTERQVELCRTYCVRLGLEHDPDRDVYSDEARSGRNIWGRQSLQQMLDAVLAGQYRYVVIEDGDRLSRDLSDLSWLAKTLQEAGVELHSTTRGKLDSRHVVMDGLLSSETLAQMVVRADYSRRRRAQEGLCMGGVAFGYDRVPGQAGKCVVNPAQAEHVRWIYETYLAGTLSPTQIARDLQRRGVDGPSGTCSWNDGTVRRILSNPRYCGLLIYGRRQTWRNPADRTWCQRVTDPQTWIVAEVEDWVIVDRETWNRVQVRMKERSLLAPGGLAGTRAPARKVENLLTKRIKCPFCEEGFYAVDHSSKGESRIRCNRYAQERGCTNSRSYLMHMVEAAVVRCVGDALADEAGLAAFADAQARALQKRERAAVDERPRLERRIAAAEGELHATFKVPEGIGEAEWGRTVAGLQAKLARELGALRHELSNLGSAPPQSVSIDPDRLGDLRQAFSELAATAPFRPVDEAGQRLKAAFRDFVTGVILHPGEEPGEFRIEVTTQMGELVPGVQRSMNLSAHHRLPPTGFRGDPDRVMRAREMAERREFALTDAEWELVEPLVPPETGRGRWARDCIPARTLVDIALYRIEARVPWRQIPDTFGEPVMVLAAMRRLAFCGAWDRVLACLKASSPERFEGKDPHDVAVLGLLTRRSLEARRSPI